MKLSVRRNRFKSVVRRLAVDPEIQSQADNQKIALTPIVLLIHQTKSSVHRKVEVVNKYHLTTR